MAISRTATLIGNLVFSGKWIPGPGHKTTPISSIRHLKRMIGNRIFHLYLPDPQMMDQTISCRVEFNGTDQTIDKTERTKIAENMQFIASRFAYVEIFKTEDLEIADTIIDILFDGKQDLIRTIPEKSEITLEEKDYAETLSDQNSSIAVISGIPGYNKHEPSLYMMIARPDWIVNPDAYLMSLSMEYESGDDLRNVELFYAVPSINEKYFSPMNDEFSANRNFIAEALSIQNDMSLNETIRQTAHSFLLPCPTSRELSRLRQALAPVCNRILRHRDMVAHSQESSSGNLQEAIHKQEKLKEVKNE